MVYKINPIGKYEIINVVQCIIWVIRKQKINTMLIDHNFPVWEGMILGGKILEVKLLNFISDLGQDLKSYLNRLWALKIQKVQKVGCTLPNFLQ